MRILIASLILCSACGSSVSNTKEAVDSVSPLNQNDAELIANSVTSSPKSIDRSRLIGAWTDGIGDNATFDIGKDSIFYLDEMTSFPYTLKGDSLTIVYPDMSFQGTAQFSGDTLILSDPEFGTTKYTRFKD